MLNVSRITSRDPAWVAFFTSLLLSFIMVITDDLINSDGILYVEVTTKILDGDWAAARSLYNWIFYPILISVISKFTFLGPETSAHILNALLLGILAYYFVRCSEELGGNRRVVIFSIILLFTNIALNGYRDLIVRDFGYWAFFFSALFFFLKFTNTEQKKYAIGFAVSIVIATLFRIEGIVFALAAPLLLLFQKGEFKKRVLQLLSIISPIAIVALFVFVYLESATSSGTGRLLDPFSFLNGALNNISQGIEEKGELLVKHVMGIRNRSMGTEGVIALLLMFLVVKLIKTTGIIATLFSGWVALSAEQQQRIRNFRVLVGFIFINFCILVVFLLSHDFLSVRYVMTFALLLTLSAAFGLEAFFRGEVPHLLRFSDSGYKRAKILIVIVLVYALLDSLISLSPSKSYLRESGVWLKNNSESSEKLLANEASLYYYSGRKVGGATNQLYTQVYNDVLPDIEELEKQGYSYLAIKISRKQIGFEKKAVAWFASQPVYRSENERGDKVLIFKLKK